MTILDLVRLVQRRIKLVIALPILFMVVALLWSLFIQASYVATASFITSGDLAFAQGLASKEAVSYSSSGIEVSCTSQNTSKQVTITAKGSDASACVNAANSVANNAVSQYKSVNSNVAASVTQASSAIRDTPSPFKVIFIAFVAGLFVAFCIIVLMDIVEAPIKSHEDAENACDLPVLGDAISAEGGDRVLANLEFCCGGRPATTAVIPVEDAESAMIVSSELIGALDRSNVRSKLVKGSPYARKFQVYVPEDAAVVVCCPPLSAGAGATYIANNSDATVLCVREWADSRRQLAATVRELKLAKANLAGLAYLPEDKEKLKSKDKAQKAKKKKKKK